MASVARVGDAVAVFQPPGFPMMALAAGIPQAGTIVFPLAVTGVVQAGSSKFRVGGLGVAHIGDPVMVPMPPTLLVTGTIAGTLTFVVPLQGTIEAGSGVFSQGGRGLARVGDSVMIVFPPAVAFVGTVAGQPFASPLQILTPVRGIIQGGSRSLSVAL